ncbi:MAG: hypothetical protein SXU28_11995 [Pseudomonadota bacterium]|nr:hypothetical protein [Pseudomonadota bacterium]
MALNSRFTGALGPAMGMAAALSMAASPAGAAELPQAPATGSSLALIDGFSSSTFKPGSELNEWRRCGWRRCYRRGWRGRRGVRTGDVIAGVAILGGIAAIASAANNNRRRDREVVVVERDRRVDRRDDRRVQRRSTGGSGIDNAVSQCLTEIERDVRVDSVDGASRVASGWVVSGTLFNGSGFTCEIGNNGQISGIDYQGFSSSNFRGSDAADGQWSDDRYASARAGVSGQRVAQADTRAAQPLVPLTSDRQPAYPGGPLPGDE